MTDIEYLVIITEPSSKKNHMIDEELVSKVEKKLPDEKGGTLYLILHTNGGDPFSAVRIMDIINERYSEVFAIVPDRAMSAGTLMALGTNAIYMGQKSKLGPLDLPIEHPKDGTRISALDVQNTITNLSALVDNITKKRFKVLRDLKVGKDTAACEAMECATNFLEPIITQIDPYHLQKAYRELKIALFYTSDLLLSRMMTNTEKAMNTAKALVNSFPAHEYAILRKEAKYGLGLEIKNLEEFKTWDILKDEYAKIESTKYYDVQYGKKRTKKIKRKTKK